MIGATFCSGIGTPELACPEIDWRLASEIEEFPRRVLQYRFGAHDVRASGLEPGGHALWGDLTTVRVRHLRRLGVPLPHVIVAGTPCQAFSVAGLRGGLSDARGNLTMEFLRVVHAFRTAGSLRNLVWENVPGVLNHRDNPFGCFLAGVVGADDALHPPEGNKWPDEGMVEGPWARAAWRVFDAQYAGLAQRRNRVFVVADFGERGADPAAVLFESIGLYGDSPPSRETRQDPADATARSVALRGRDGGAAAELGDDVSTALRGAGGGGDKAHVLAPTIPSRTKAGGGLGTDFDLDGGLQPVLTFGGGNTAGQRRVATALSTSNQRIDFDTETFVVDRPTYAVQAGALRQNPNSGPDGVGVQEDLAYTLETRSEVQAVVHGLDQRVVHALRGEGFDASEDGTGRGTPIVPVRAEVSACDVADTLSVGANQTTGFAGDVVACGSPIPFDTTQITSKANYSKPQAGDPVHPLAATAHAPAMAFSSKDYGADATEELSPTVRAGGHSESHANAGTPPAVALRAPIAFDGKAGGNTSFSIGEKPGALRGDGNGGGHATVALDDDGSMGWRVRRLTPLECERLQGLPDDWTRIPIRPSEPKITRLRPADMWEEIDGQWWLMSADGPRYKAIGNGMAAPVVGWILKRVVEMQP